MATGDESAQIKQVEEGIRAIRITLDSIASTGASRSLHIEKAVSALNECSAFSMLAISAKEKEWEH